MHPSVLVSPTLSNYFKLNSFYLEYEEISIKYGLNKNKLTFNPETGSEAIYFCVREPSDDSNMALPG